MRSSSLLKFRANIRLLIKPIMHNLIRKTLFLLIVLLLTCLVCAQGLSPLKLARITDVQIIDREAHEGGGYIMFHIKSEDCWLEDDYRLESYEQILVFTIYSQSCESSLKPIFAERGIYLPIVLEPNPHQYTAFFNDYAIRFTLDSYIVHLNRYIASLRILSQTNDAITFIAKGYYPNNCFKEVYTHMYEQQKNTLFVTLLGKIDGAYACGAAMSEFKYLLKIPTLGLSEGTYTIRLDRKIRRNKPTSIKKIFEIK